MNKMTLDEMADSLAYISGGIMSNVGPNPNNDQILSLIGTLHYLIDYLKENQNGTNPNAGGQDSIPVS